MESPLRTDQPDDLKIIETLGYHPVQGLRHLELHLARMGNSALALGFEWDIETAREVLSGVSGDAPLRVRLTLGAGRDYELTTAPAVGVEGDWKVAISDTRLRSGDPWLQHKTTNRSLYDRERAALPKDLDELLYLNEHGALCEGTITNLFVDLGEGLVTPPRSAGLLPGVLRRSMMANGILREAEVRPEDLAGARRVFVGNAFRGLIAVEMV